VTASSGLAQTALASACLPLTREHPGLSGIVPLREGHDAFAARVPLADHAEQTLDVQYYIWHDDISGTLLLDAVRRATDRGVRVRLRSVADARDGTGVGLRLAVAALSVLPIEWVL
jgi:putative cardiolipin synthase